MFKPNRLAAATACALLLQVLIAHAAVTPEEAAKLKTTLTPLGGERAGNNDGSIPAWNGGYTKVSPGWQPGDLRPDPFSDEKPILRITGKDVEQYADKLSDGVKALLKKHPDFRVDVYPTHRTAAAPQWMYDNTFKNATQTKLSDDGSIENARGGVLFPIPKDGREVMWNYLTAWGGGVGVEAVLRGIVVLADGKPILSDQMRFERKVPLYENKDQITLGFYRMNRFVQSAPAFKVGESMLMREALTSRGQEAHQYLVGQRRVRRAPDLRFDTPNPTTSGQGHMDELFVFNGSLEMYDWKLIGKKEMFIPYNNNKFYSFKESDLFSNGVFNPDTLRWELHRVWVVEATLAAGKRHVVPKRRFFVDEDSWYAVMADGWDGQGQLWRMNLGIPFVAADGPGIVMASYTTRDLLSGVTVMGGLFNETHLKYKLTTPKPDSYFTPEALAGDSLR